MTTSSFHDPSGSLAGMVIDFARSLWLHAADPEWGAWLGPRLRGCVALEVMDDSLTRWRALYAQPQGRQYLVPITTPPGKREWLIGWTLPSGIHQG